jgi:hypothetical protein
LSPSHSLVLTQNRVVYLIEMNIEGMSNEEVEEALANIIESFSLRLSELKVVVGLYEDPTMNHYSRDLLVKSLNAKYDAVRLCPMRLDPMIYTDATMFARHVFVPDGAIYLKIVRANGRFVINTSSSDLSVYYCRSKLTDSCVLQSEYRVCLRDVRWIYMLIQCMILSAIKYMMAIGPPMVVWLIESLTDRELGIRKPKNIVIQPILWSYPMERYSAKPSATQQIIVNGCCLVEERLEACTFATGFYSIVYFRLYNLVMMFLSFLWCIFTNWLGSTAFIIYMSSVAMLIWHVCDSTYRPRWLLVRRLERSRIGTLLACITLSFFVVYGAPLCHFLFLFSAQ